MMFTAYQLSICALRGFHAGTPVPTFSKTTVTTKTTKTMGG
jgi:hypothetical protein